MSNDTQAAIRTHGARAVYKAATKRLHGDKSALAALGLVAPTLGEANAIMATAFEQLGQADRAIDAADAQARLA